MLSFTSIPSSFSRQSLSAYHLLRPAYDMRCGIAETVHHGIAETVHCGIAETSLTGTSSPNNDIEPIGHCLCTYKGIRFSRDSSKRAILVCQM